MTDKIKFNPFTGNFDYVVSYDQDLNTTDDVTFNSVTSTTYVKVDSTLDLKNLSGVVSNLIGYGRVFTKTDGELYYKNSGEYKVLTEDAILTDLSDVTITSPVLGDMLWHDGTDWKKFDRPSASGTYEIRNDQTGDLRWILSTTIPSDIFKTFSPDLGDAIVADTSTDTAYFTSSDESIKITGTSASNALNFQLKTGNDYTWGGKHTWNETIDTHLMKGKLQLNNTLYGGSSSGSNLTMDSTSHATKGKIVLSSSTRPSSDNVYDMGTTSINWKDFYLSGTAYLDTGLQVSLPGVGAFVRAFDVSGAGGTGIFFHRYSGASGGVAIGTTSNVYHKFGAMGSGDVGDVQHTDGVRSMDYDASVNILSVSDGAGAIQSPTVTTAQRPTGVNGMIVYNSTTLKVEVYENGTWRTI